MERLAKCYLLVLLALWLGCMCVVGEDAMMGQVYNDERFNRDIDEEDEGTEALHDLIGQYINDVNAQNNLRDTILAETLDHSQLGAQQTKRAGRCRAGRCILRGANPNTGSRVLPFGKRDDDVPVNQVARRGRGSARNVRPRGDRPLLPFGKRR